MIELNIPECIPSSLHNSYRQWWMATSSGKRQRMLQNFLEFSQWCSLSEPYEHCICACGWSEKTEEDRRIETIHYPISNRESVNLELLLPFSFCEDWQLRRGVLFSGFKESRASSIWINRRSKSYMPRCFNGVCSDVKLILDPKSTF